MPPNSSKFRKSPTSDEDFPQLARSKHQSIWIPNRGRCGRNMQVASVPLEQPPSQPTPQSVVQPLQEPAADSPEIQLSEPPPQPPAVRSQLTSAPPAKPKSPLTPPPSQIPVPQPALNPPSHPPTKPPSPPANPQERRSELPTPPPSLLPLSQQAESLAQPLVQPASNPSSQTSVPSPTPSQAEERPPVPAEPPPPPPSKPVQSSEMPPPGGLPTEPPVLDDESVEGSKLAEAEGHLRTGRHADAMLCCVHLLRQGEHEAPKQAALSIIEKSLECGLRKHICDIENEKMSWAARLNVKQDNVDDLKAAIKKERVEQRELRRGLLDTNCRLEGENQRLLDESRHLQEEWDRSRVRHQEDIYRLRNESLYYQEQNRLCQSEIDRLGFETRRLQQQLQRPQPLQPKDFMDELLKHELKTLHGLIGDAKANARRKLLLKWHPDKHPGNDAWATKVMQEMQNFPAWRS